MWMSDVPPALSRMRCRPGPLPLVIRRHALCVSCIGLNGESLHHPEPLAYAVLVTSFSSGPFDADTPVVGDPSPRFTFLTSFHTSASIELTIDPTRAMALMSSFLRPFRTSTEFSRILDTRCRGASAGTVSRTSQRPTRQVVWIDISLHRARTLRGLTPHMTVQPAGLEPATNAAVARLPAAVCRATSGWANGVGAVRVWPSRRRPGHLFPASARAHVPPAPRREPKVARSGSGSARSTDALHVPYFRGVHGLSTTPASGILCDWHSALSVDLNQGPGSRRR